MSDYLFAEYLWCLDVFHANSTILSLSKIVSFEQNPFSREKNGPIEFENDAVRNFINVSNHNIVG